MAIVDSKPGAQENVSPRCALLAGAFYAQPFGLTHSTPPPPCFGIADVFLRDEDDARSYQEARDDIDQVAMSADATTKLFAETASRLENGR